MITTIQRREIGENCLMPYYRPEWPDRLALFLQLVAAVVFVFYLLFKLIFP